METRGERAKKIVRHTDLEVYQCAFAAAMKIFELTKNFRQRSAIH